MKTFHSAAAFSTLALLIGASIASGDALAVDKTRIGYINATGACQSALPVFDGVIRKRPLGVQNEGPQGSADSFVNCSLPGQSGSQITKVTLDLATIPGGVIPNNIGCTGINGFYGGNAKYVTKNVIANADGTAVTMQWTAADFNAASFPSDIFNIQCKMPRGTGIYVIATYYSEDVGA
ncbi:MAG: hypothetical protein ABJA62_04910 [Luteimonas sp.]